MAAQVENWDDDADFQGDLFSTSQSTAPASISSRLSVRSESVAADDDWQMDFAPNDESSRSDAIASAAKIGIPLPHNVPPSALLGGSIKRLGKKKSKPKIADDDWGDDLEIPESFDAKLKLNNKTDLSVLEARLSPTTPANQDEFDTDWAEGSLGIRFGGTRRDQRQRSSSASAMSPSMGSCITLESEDDDLGGLVLPDEPIDFSDRLKRKKDVDKDSPISVSTDSFNRKAQPEKPTLKKQRTEDDDMAFGLDFGNTDLIDKRKRKIHPAIKITESKFHPSPPRRAITTITFTDTPAASRIPRPAQPSSTLDPVYESMASHMSPRTPRPPITTTSAQLLRSKRSAPALSTRSKPDASPRPPLPTLPANASRLGAASRLPSHGRHVASQDRPSVPDLRSASRLSTDRNTPSRLGSRRDVAPPTLARQAANHRTLHVTKRRNFGDGSELERFDDLPTSATKESKFIKEPSNRAGVQRTLRHKPSMTKLNNAPDRMTTPQPHQSYPSSTTSNNLPSTPGAPPTPRSTYFPVKTTNTPSFARDTAASRIAREQRLGPVQPLRPREGGPLAAVSINWKAQVAARSPHNSPTAHRKNKGEVKQPVLIKQMSLGAMRNEKGMTYNPALQRWEGNEHALHNFENPSAPSLPLQKGNHVFHHQHSGSVASSIFGGGHAVIPQRNNNASPPRPALISQISAAGVRIERGMVFDPQQMKWLKLDPKSMNTDVNAVTSPGALSIEEEDDPFAGLENLKDEREIMLSPGTLSLTSLDQQQHNKENNRPGGMASDDWTIGEEFDVGPSFVKRQRHEEGEWRRRVEGWMTAGWGASGHDERWKWEVRDVAREYGL